MRVPSNPSSLQGKAFTSTKILAFLYWLQGQAITAKGSKDIDVRFVPIPCFIGCHVLEGCMWTVILNFDNREQYFWPPLKVKTRLDHGWVKFVHEDSVQDLS